MTPPSPFSAPLSRSQICIRALLLALIIAIAAGCAPTSTISRSTEQAPILRTEKQQKSLPNGQGLAVVSLPNNSTDVEDFSPTEPEQTVAQEVAELGKLGRWEEGSPEEISTGLSVDSDFPVTLNRQVQFYLDFFQNKQSQAFTTWLSRSTRYMPMIRQQLQEAGLPLDLAYLPMIESGYSLIAYSSAGAVGPWQFMEATARQYGLRIDSHVDERRNPEAATKAAVQFLSELYDEFGSWHLAVAAYNAGGGTLRRAMRKTMSSNFWTIAQSEYLADETKLYVPKLIAAIIVAKNPEKYGFTNLDYQEPIAYDTIEVPPTTAVKAVALAGDLPTESVRDLNRELRKGLSPPGEIYQLKIPVGSGDAILANLSRVRGIEKTVFKDHRVQKNDTLSSVCKNYELDKITLLKANNLRKSKLTPGQVLRIPQQVTEYELLSKEEFASALAAPTGDKLVLHRIHKGETISAIAVKYGVSSTQIAQWNSMANLNRIREGQLLSLYIANSTSTQVTGQLAAVTKTPTGSSPRVITATVMKRKPGQIQTASRKINEPRLTLYQVQNGDSLWEIARRYKLSLEDIKAWNHLKDDAIRPGKRLILKTTEDIGA